MKNWKDNLTNINFSEQLIYEINGNEKIIDGPIFEPSAINKNEPIDIIDVDHDSAQASSKNNHLSTLDTNFNGQFDGTYNGYDFITSNLEHPRNPYDMIDWFNHQLCYMKTFLKENHKNTKITPEIDEKIGKLSKDVECIRQDLFNQYFKITSENCNLTDKIEQIKQRSTATKTTSNSINNETPSFDAKIEKIMKLSKRLNSLENCLFGESIPHNKLSSSNFIERIDAIETKLHYFDKNYLKAIKTFLQDNEQSFLKLEHIDNEHPLFTEISKTTKIRDNLNKWHTFVGSLPDLIERLTILKKTHDNSIDAVDKLKQLEDIVTNISVSFNDNKELYNKLSSTITKNATDLSSALTVLENKLKK